MDITLYPNEIPYHFADADGKPTVTSFPAEGWYPTPTVIVLPGGGYRNHADHEAEPIAEFYRSCGFHAFVLRYRLLPNLYPAALCDVQRLIKYLRFHAEELKVDPEHIFVIGFSAGGHLAGHCTVAEDVCQLGDDLDAQSHRPNGAILCYPVVNTNSHQSVRLIAGKEALYEKLSVDKQVTPDTPPMFLWHTAEDTVVDVRQSLSLATALKENNVPFELHIYPHGKHGLGLAKRYPDVSTWAEHSVQWLRGQCDA